MKGFLVKGEKKIQLMLEGENNICITAMDDIDLQQIGFLNFKILEHGQAYLSSIRVTDIDFLRCGVGAVMLNCFENYCITKGATTIDGKFCPNSDGGIFAREFYENNGYSIYKTDGEQHIYKDLTHKQIDERYLLGNEENEEISEVFEETYRQVKLEDEITSPAHFSLSPTEDPAQ